MPETCLNLIGGAWVAGDHAVENRNPSDLADLIGVSRQAVNAIEKGKFVPSTILALKMARVFGTPVEQIFELESGD